MKFLTEVTEHTKVECIKESDANGREYVKDVFIHGIFLEANTKNRNGRIYPLDILANEVHRYTETMINTGRALGELGHPDTSSINLERASHLIKEIKQDGNTFIGKAKILKDTPYGAIAKNFVEEGVQLGVSSRGFGTMTSRDGADYVGDDFFLSTVDIVADPSAPHAFVNGIMENKEFYFENGILLEKDYERIQKTVNNLSKNELSEGALMNIFSSFMKTLK